MAENKGLGKGLDSFFDESFLEDIDSTKDNFKQTVVPIEKLEINPFQPRREIDKDELQNLAQSIRQAGILQPLLVRKKKNIYQIIAGERRYRAAKQAGLKEIPVHVIAIPDSRLLELALLENLHRKDLNVMDQAEALSRLLKEYRYTHALISEKVVMDRSTVTNLLRLLQLPDEIRELLRQKKLSGGHGRALLPLKRKQDILKTAHLIRKNHWSVRKTESYVKKLLTSQYSADKEKDPDLLAWEEKLSKKFGMKTTLSFSGKKGHITLHFRSLDDFDRLIKSLLPDES